MRMPSPRKSGLAFAHGWRRASANTEAERQALEQLVTIVHDSWAIDRLALLAWNAGSADRARELRRRKAKLDAGQGSLPPADG